MINTQTMSEILVKSMIARLLLFIVSTDFPLIFIPMISVLFKRLSTITATKENCIKTTGRMRKVICYRTRRYESTAVNAMGFPSSSLSVKTRFPLIQSLDWTRNQLGILCWQKDEVFVKSFAKSKERRRWKRVTEGKKQRSQD